MEVTHQQAIRRQVIFWLSALAIFLITLWVLGNILFPFIAGLALAYFLDPVADLLERWGFNRLAATIVILVGFLVVVVLALLIVVPLITTQVAELIDRIPYIVASLREMAAAMDFDWLDSILEGREELLGENAGNIVSKGAEWLAAFLGKVWSSGRALISLISLLIVTPVVAFYMLYDWDRLVAKIDEWLPRDHRDEVHMIMSDIDSAVAGFVRGQGTLCLILGVFYALGLTLVGLNFGLIIGLFAGLISFIPYVGSVTGFVLSVGVALVQFWPDPTKVVIVAAIFVAGQFMEGNFLQPKLVGDRVGLHPVWVMFALFAFGTLFGFTGLLVAVPAAAVIGVLLRYAMGHYLNSELYHGHQRVTGTDDLPPGHA